MKDKHELTKAQDEEKQKKEKRIKRIWIGASVSEIQEFNSKLSN